jgi:hypothetical protein
MFAIFISLLLDILGVIYHSNSVSVVYIPRFLASFTILTASPQSIFLVFSAPILSSDELILFTNATQG